MNPKLTTHPTADLPPELADHPKFCILKELGRGGMGVVYQAEHRFMEMTVALKVISKRLLAHPAALERFDREVRAAARLVHPHIVRALDADRAGELRILVMEFIEGVSLSDVLKKKGPLPIPHACHYVRQAALGLQHAHDQGMVHRDIKPHNLMLTPRGQVKILDFGLARLASEQKYQGGLTRTGEFMGTPDYVAPEQATDASRADIRADVYSLGCTLYCLLAGRPPFQESSVVEQVLAHVKKTAVSLSAVRADIPADLSAVVERMLAKDPAQRFQTPLEVARALAPFCKASQKSASPPLPAAPEAALDNRTALPGGPGRVKELGLSAVKLPSREEMAPARENQSPIASPARRRPIVVATVWAAILALAVGAWLLAAVIFRVETDKGTLVVEINDPEVEARIKNGQLILSGPDGKVRYTLTPGERTKQIEAGPYQIRVQGADGLELDTQEFTLRKGGLTTVCVTLKPVETPKNDPPGKPVASNLLSVGLGNGVKMEFVRVPSGKSWLGGGGKPGTREVEFTHDFYLGKYEVTQEEWQQLIGKNPSCFFPGGKNEKGVKDIPAEDLKRFPVENVSWHDCQAFLEKLNGRAKEPGWLYRLPTEAEWEYACRGGPSSSNAEAAFSFYFATGTNQLRPDQANFKHPECPKRTSRVGSYPPNRLGLCDMHGNVIEWCADGWVGRGRSYRGGCWSDGPERCQAAFRFGNGEPASRDNYLGLRVARVPATNENNAPTRPDALQAGTIWQGTLTYRKGLWAGSTVSYEIQVQERTGKQFKGLRFDNGPNRNRGNVDGVVEGETVTWREDALRTVEGKLVGDGIRLTFKGNYGGRTTEGDGELKRNK